MPGLGSVVGDALGVTELPGPGLDVSNGMLSPAKATAVTAAASRNLVLAFI
jgi:hypothetical protein